MVQFLLENKEWLFSGIGVAILVGLWGLIRYLKREYLGRPSEIVNQLTDEGEDAPPQLTVDSITSEINNAPPYQRQQVADQYKGIEVEWSGELWDVKHSAFGSDNEDDVRVSVSTSSIIVQFHFNVSLSTFPKLKVMRRGDPITVTGKIKDCSGEGMYVELEADRIDL